MAFLARPVISHGEPRGTASTFLRPGRRLFRDLGPQPGDGVDHVLLTIALEVIGDFIASGSATIPDYSSPSLRRGQERLRIPNTRFECYRARSCQSLTTGKAYRDPSVDYPDGRGWWSMERNSSSRIGRAPAVLGQAGDDGPDLRGIADNGDDGPRVSTPGTAQRNDIVNHGHKTRPCLPAVARAYSPNLSGFPRGRRPILLPAVPALGGSRGEGGVVFPGSTAAGGIQTVAAQLMPAAGGMWSVCGAMKSRQEQWRSWPL